MPVDGDDGRVHWYREAARIALRLVEAEPSVAHQMLAGEALMGSRDYAAAGRRFEQALELDPGNAKALYYVASCELAEGRAASALGHFETADVQID